MQVLFDRINQVIRAAGYQLWWVHWLSGHTLQVFIDSPKGISIDDCEKVSRELSAYLDVIDAEIGAPASYNLQVSSPGADRVLFTSSQCKDYLGYKVRCRLHRAQEGKRVFQGVLSDVDNNNITIKLSDSLSQFGMSEIKELRVVYNPHEDFNRNIKEDLT